MAKTSIANQLTARKIRFFALTTVEHWSIRALDAITTIMLIRSLNREALGTFVVYQAWVGVLLLLFPSLENILYREYRQLRDSGRLGMELAVFRKFNLIKIATALFFVLVCSVLPVVGIPQTVSWSERLAALALAFALPLSQALYGIYREILRFELFQGSIVFISILQRLTVIAAVYFASQAFEGSIVSISVFVLAAFVGFGVIWAASVRVLMKSIPHTPISLQQALPRMRKILNDAILWIHLNGALTIAIQTLDVYFISHSKTALAEIAVYSVALKAANFFQILPLPFAQVFSVYLGRKSGADTPKTAVQIVLGGTLFFLGIGAAMCAAGFMLGEPLLAFLAKGKFSSEELLRGKVYFQWQLVGVAAYLLCFAPGAYINRHAKLKAMTLFVFVPWFLFSALGYAWVAQYGPEAVAKFNVPVYIWCGFAHLVYFAYWIKNRS